MGTSVLDVYMQRYQRRAELREALLSLLQDNVERIHCVPGALPDGSDGYGFRSGHVNNLLQLVRVKGDPDIFDERLKLELFREMLGGYPVLKKDVHGTKYFVSSYEAWQKTLRKPLGVVDQRISA